jgi:hypothetical protein
MLRPLLCIGLSLERRGLERVSPQPNLHVVSFSALSVCSFAYGRHGLYLSVVVFESRWRECSCG